MGIWTRLFRKRRRGRSEGSDERMATDQDSAERRNFDIVVCPSTRQFPVCDPSISLGGNNEQVVGLGMPRSANPLDAAPGTAVAHSTCARTCARIQMLEHLHLENIGGPGRTRTCNQTVMSGAVCCAHAVFQAVSQSLRASCSICVHDYLCGTCANWRGE